MRYLPLLVLLAFLSTSIPLSCQVAESHTGNQLPERPLPNKDSLYQQLRQAESITLIIPDRSPESEAYLAFATSISENRRYNQFTIVPASDISDSLLAEKPAIFLGDISSLKTLGPWTRSLPIGLLDDGFSFQDTRYKEPHHCLALSWYPNPIEPFSPLALVTGNSDEAILAHLNGAGRGRRSIFGWGSWDFQVFAGEEKLVIGNYALDWKMDPTTRWEFDPNQEPSMVNDVVKVFPHQEVPESITQALTDSVEDRLARWNQWLGWSEDSLPDYIPMEYHLWSHPEDMGINTGEMATGFRQGEKIHRIVHPAFIEQDPGLEWTWWMDQSLGSPSRQVFQDGLRVILTPDFQGLGYRSLAASLIRAEGKVPTTVMFDPQAYERESPLVRDCYAGAIVEFLIGYLGKTEFIRLYQDMDPTILSDSFSQVWSEFQSQLLSETPVRTGNSSLPAYYKGMTFAHEGYQVFNGYGSRQAENALEHLASIGSNAVAIVPYTGTSNPRSKEPLRWSRGAGGENDASVILSHHGTQHAGMITMLKPQVWVRGGWPGDVDMPGEEDWEVWFDHYHRWIRHYAVLAEIHQMEILCLGTEFRYATLKHPDRWRDLVMKIRKIYHGTITYAANWGEEVENLGFADVLDFVGVNCYYPLSGKEQPSDEELSRKVEEVLDMLDGLSRKWEIPYVLTEIGFRSIDQPWKHPHAEANGAQPNQQHQARCYSAVLNALPGHPACKGLFWWKWPSYEQYAHRVPTSFTPCGKEAQQVLQEAYRAW